MKKRIKHATVQRIALCKYPKNGLSTMLKSDGHFEIQAVMSKSEIEQGLLTAIVYAPDLDDSDGWFAKSDAIRDFGHRFLKDGSMELDIEHDGKVLSRDDVYVAESWMLSGTEPFLKSITYNGNPVDPAAMAGAWAVRIKLESEQAKQSARNGDFDGVSMFGLAALETVQKSAAQRAVDRLKTEAGKGTKMDETKLEAMFKSLGDRLVAALTPKAPETPAVKAEDKPVVEQAPEFKGDPDSDKDLAAYEKSLRAFELRKASKSGKLTADQVAELRKARKDAAQEPATDDEVGIVKSDSEEVRNLKRENYELKKASNAGTGDNAPTKKSKGTGSTTEQFAKGIAARANRTSERADSFSVVAG